MVRESHSSPRSASDAAAQLGEVAYLTVTAVNNIGAFLQWGQPKDVLLPFSEQQFRPDPGKGSSESPLLGAYFPGRRYSAIAPRPIS